MPFVITVTKREPGPNPTPGLVNPAIEESEIYRQTVEDFNLSKFVIALNKEPRASRRKGAQVRTVGAGAA